MRPLRSALLAQAGLLLALAAAVPPALALTPAELFAKVAPSVWRVRTYDKEGLPLGLGSAVVVAPETLVTNCHVLRKAERFVLLHDNLSLPGTLELWDAPRDVCQVKARGLNAPAVALGETRGLVVGQNVYALGSPAGLELTLSAGLVSSRRPAGAGLPSVRPARRRRLVPAPAPAGAAGCVRPRPRRPGEIQGRGSPLGPAHSP